MSRQATKLPSAFRLFAPSWQALKVNLWTFIFLFLTPFLVAIVGAGLIFGISGAYDSSSASQAMNVLLIVGGMVLVLACVYFYIVLQVGLLAAELKGAQKAKLTFGDALKYGTRYWFRMLVLGLAVALLVIVGLVLLIVPGLFMLKRYYLAPYYLLDQNLTALEAMRRSAADSRRYGGAIWGLLGVTLLIGIAGAILDIVPVLGWIASAILTVAYLCAPAVRYLQIKHDLAAHHHLGAAPVPMPPTSASA